MKMVYIVYGRFNDHVESAIAAYGDLGLAKNHIRHAMREGVDEYGHETASPAQILGLRSMRIQHLKVEE